MNIETNKKRIFYLDFTRALAIILVLVAHISTHTCEKFIKICAIGSIRWCVFASLVDFGCIGVPLFLMLTGILLLNRDYHSLQSFFKHRFSRILIPVIFWGLFNLIYGNVFNLGMPEVVKTFFSSNWYVWMLVGIYLMLPILNSFIKEYKMKGVEYFLIIWLIIIILNTFKLYPFYRVELSYFAGYIGYVVLGYYLVNKKFKLSDKKMMLIGMALFIIFTLIQLKYIFEISPIYSKQMWLTYLTIVVVLQSSGVFLFLKSFDSYCNKSPKSISNKIYSKIKNTFISKIIISISFCSYGMYLVHGYILDYLLSTSFIKNIFLINPLVWLIISLIAIPLISWIIILIMSKIPYLKHFSGV